MAINTIIIDDNPQATRALEEMLLLHEAINIVGKATNLAEAEEMIEMYRPSLLFIDVELPDGSGIDFWAELRNSSAWFMHAVFYTAYDHYAISALRAQAHDFLVKPVTKDEVDAALKRFFTACTVQFVENQRGGLDFRRPDDSTTTIMVLDNLGNRSVMRLDDICFFRYVSQRKIWEVMHRTGECCTLRHGINAARLLQLSQDYVQVHKSYIINVRYVYRIENSQIYFFPPCDKFDEV